MDSIDLFTVRDLRSRTGDLLREAQAGRLSVITEHGRPVILAIPFDAHLLHEGVNRSLAVRLYEGGEVTLAQAAKVAALRLDEFIDLLDTAGVPVVDYPPDELEREVEVAG